jgi:hypothetical protein
VPQRIRNFPRAMPPLSSGTSRSCALSTDGNNHALTELIQNTALIFQKHWPAAINHVAHGV